MDESKFLRDLKLLVAIYDSTATNLKRNNIIECIKNGADVNVKFANNENNTPLHVAVSKSDKVIVNILLKHGAKANIPNDAGKTALQLAKELPVSSDIVEVLVTHEEAITRTEVDTALDNKAITTASRCKYKKRPGTANVRGQLYETKLLTVIYLRSLRCKQIIQFHLGTNLDEIGDLDDVCLRFKTSNQDCIVFLQAKYRHDVVKGRLGVQDLWKSSGDFSLLKYFDSYMKIREKFNTNSDDELFRGRYKDIKCYYVMYTTVKDDINVTRKRPVADDIVNDLIGTGGQQSIFQFICEEQYVISLTQVKLMERLKIMGKKLIKLIQDDKYNHMMLCDENIRSFHVVLAQKVINVTEVNSEGHRTGTFRKEFFSSNEQLVIVLRDTLYAEVLKNNKLSSEEIEDAINEILIQPTPDSISELIGCILMYDSSTGTLKVTDEAIENSFAYQCKLESLQVAQSDVNDAFDIAGRRKLQELVFKLPAAFGNFDMTLNKKKVERRLEYLAQKIVDVIKKFADVDGNIVIREGMFASNKQLETGILGINGGIAGAVGNLLLFDDENKLKFNLDVDSLGENAKKLYLKLIERLGDLSMYRICVEIEDFPRLSLHATEHEKRYARDFLKNLYFYTYQAKEEHLEDIATKELQAHEGTVGISKSESRIKSNALFLKVHNEIQIWWMIDQTAYYLTRNMEHFDRIFSDMKNKGFLTFLNFVYLNKIYNADLEFKADAVDVLSICKHYTDGARMIVVNTDVHVLTCNKLIQYFKDADDYIFIDIDYLCRVSSNCLEIIEIELSGMDTCKVIIVCSDLSKTNYNIDDIIKWCGNKLIILVTSTYAQKEKYNCLRDYRNNLIDLTEASQQKVLKSQFIYQGVEVTFAEIFNEAKHLINAKILQKIINNEKIALGPTLELSTYEEIKHYYVPRFLERNISLNATDMTSSGRSHAFDSSSSTNDDMYSLFSPSTLIDHYDMCKNSQNRAIYDVVLVLEAPGMGKSTLLTHLSVETKRRYPEIWIQRINLIDHTKQFNEWHENKTEVSRSEALKFICKVVLSDMLRTEMSNLFNSIQFEIINGEVKLDSCEVNCLLESFELGTFLNCFKQGNIVFLFDGFDEISPHYKNEVTQLLQCLVRRDPICDAPVDDTCKGKRERCVWITSRPYNDLKNTLEKEFGGSYTLLPFSYFDICLFVDKYLRRNMNLDTLTQEQLKNIDGFFEYMKSFDLRRSHTETAHTMNVTNVQLHGIYTAAVEYFKSEIKQTPLSDDLAYYVKNWDFHEDVDIVWKLFDNSDDYAKAISLSGIPLNVYIAVHYFQNQIKDTRLADTEQRIQRWDLDTNTFIFYERFLETKLKTIRFEEKNRMDIYNPDVKLTYEREMKEFRDKHKKLAFYAMFEKDAHTVKELDEVNNIIESMEIGEDKTGLVERIVNGKPKFVHYTFAEYFAAEHIFDILKSDDPDKQQRMLDFILMDMVSYGPGFQVMFDLKLKCTSGIANALNTVFVNQHIFRTLVQQSRDPFKFSELTVLDIVVKNKLEHFAEFLIEAVINAVDETNAADFLCIIEEGTFLRNLISSKNTKLVNKIMNCITSVDAKKFYSILKSVWSERMPPFLL